MEFVALLLHGPEQGEQLLRRYTNEVIDSNVVSKKAKKIKRAAGPSSLHVSGQR